MATNVEIKKNKNENNLSMLKRFSRKVIEAGIINKVKSERYEQRKASDFVKKKNKLKVLKKKAEYEQLYKLGKIAPRKKR
jgi:heterodisulfide reductase subunit C